jgi:ribosomal protein L40E
MIEVKYMRDSTKTLKFKHNRNLDFDKSRGVDFISDRSLHFDKDRELFFNMDRKLDIRVRGVVFRGYICPLCDASVSADALKCGECGVEFKQGRSKNRRTNKMGTKKASPSKRPSSKKSRKKKGMKKTFQCPVCGRAMYVGAKQCPGCRIVF